MKAALGKHLAAGMMSLTLGGLRHEILMLVLFRCLLVSPFVHWFSPPLPIEI